MKSRRVSLPVSSRYDSPPVLSYGMPSVEEAPQVSDEPARHIVHVGDIREHRTADICIRKPVSAHVKLNEEAPVLKPVSSAPHFPIPENAAIGEAQKSPSAASPLLNVPVDSSLRPSFYLGGASDVDVGGQGQVRRPSFFEDIAHGSTDVQPQPVAMVRADKALENTSEATEPNWADEQRLNGFSHDSAKLTHSETHEKRKKRHRHRHKHRHKRRLQTKGSDVKLANLGTGDPQGGGDEDDDERRIGQFHRATGGAQHHRIISHSAMAAIIHIASRDEDGNFQETQTSRYDHEPHQMFVELEELKLGEQQEYEWQEKARWIKYEEDVKEGAGGWGKAHVSSLSFHSLIELRTCIEDGLVELDLELYDLPSIVNHLTAQMVQLSLLQPENSAQLAKTLLLRHKHVSDGHGKPFMRRNFNALNLFSMDKGRDSLNEKTKPSKKGSGLTDMLKDTQNPMQMMAATATAHSENREDYRTHFDREIEKRIPQGAEVAVVLVGKVKFLDNPVMAFIRLAHGAFLGNLTQVELPVRFIFVLMGPDDETIDYHEVGRSISTLMANAEFHDSAYHAENKDDLLSAIDNFLDESYVLPPGDYDKDNEALMPFDVTYRSSQWKKRRQTVKEDKGKFDQLEKEKPFDPLQRTKRPFGGLINDVKQRYPQYLSDIKDAMNVQCLAAFFFIYFACLSPAITFGGLLGDKTENWLGVTELLVGTSICGVLFALLSGQPMTIVGASGPVLVFEESLYGFCESFGLELLPFRFWIGFWVTVIAILVVAAEGSFFVHYFTRFTEEIFALLIACIFVYEVIKMLVKVFAKHPLLAYYEYAKHYDSYSNYTLNDTLHTTVPYQHITTSNYSTNATDYSDSKGDYYPVPKPNTALLTFILVVGTFTIATKLKEFRNSQYLGRTGRRALGDFGVPIAIVVMVLVDYAFNDTYTTKLNVPDGFRPTLSDRRGWVINPAGLEKQLPIWAMFGAILPALLLFILVFVETEIIGLIVNKKERNLKKGSCGFHLDLLLCGCFGTISGILGISVLLAPVLRQVPIAVLFGVFLYMGVNSAAGIQFLERITLFFKPVKHHPEVGYVQHVRTWRMHIYTFLQLCCLAILFGVKSSPGALAFPFVLILLVPLRLFVVKRLFAAQELNELDKEGESDPEDNDEDGPDFYKQTPLSA